MGPIDKLYLGRYFGKFTCHFGGPHLRWQDGDRETAISKAIDGILRLGLPLANVVTIWDTCC